MLFEQNELNRLRKLLDTDIGAEDVLDDYEQSIIAKTTRLERLKDHMIVPQHNKPKKTIYIVKLVTMDFDFLSFMRELSASLRPPYEVRIAFSFLMSAKDIESYVIAIPARPLNQDHRMVRDRSDRDKLLDFVGKYSHTDLLNYAFETRSVRNPFEKSGYRPQKLVTMSVWITKLNTF